MCSSFIMSKSLCRRLWVGEIQSRDDIQNIQQAAQHLTYLKDQSCSLHWGPAAPAVAPHQPCGYWNERPQGEGETELGRRVLSGGRGTVTLTVHQMSWMFQHCDTHSGVPLSPMVQELEILLHLLSKKTIY